MPTFSIKENFKKAFKLFKQHFVFLLLVTILTWGLRLGTNYLINLLNNTTLITIANLLNWLLNMIIAVGLLNISLNLVNNNTADYKDLVNKTNLLGKYILGSILYGFIVLAGFILLIIPGIVWLIKYQYLGLLIIDKNMSPKQALKRSGEITKGKKLKLLWLFILLFLFNALGALPFFVGLLITIPVSSLVVVYVYRQLNSTP